MRPTPMLEDLAVQIKRDTLDRQAAAVLRQKVLSGEFPPGHRLVETSLAEQLQLSRGTIRAALSDLVHEGLVEQIAFTRWGVPGLSATDAWELYTLRSSLEGLAASLVAERRDPSACEALRTAFDEIRTAAAADDRGRLAQVDAGLHKLVVQLAQHKRLERQYVVIEQQIRRYIACSNALAVDAEAIVKQHEPIVSAILAGLPDLAEREARRHNLEEGARLVHQLRQQEAAFNPAAKAAMEGG